MKRHAQEYWLKLQADAALELANSNPSNIVQMADEITRRATSGGIESDRRHLIHYRNVSLKVAAEALVRAEMYHRLLAGQKEVPE
jgi:hypothetical protein